MFSLCDTILFSKVLFLREELILVHVGEEHI